jgi:hypothetical protein
MTIESSIPNISYKNISNMTSTSKPPVALQQKQAEADTSEPRKGIIPGISGEFAPKTYPKQADITLGGLIDIRW